MDIQENNDKNENFNDGTDTLERVDKCKKSTRNVSKNDKIPPTSKIVKNKKIIEKVEYEQLGSNSDSEVDAKPLKKTIVFKYSEPDETPPKKVLSEKKTTTNEKHECEKKRIASGKR